MSQDSSPASTDYSEFWPRIQPTMPLGWCPPVTLHAIGSMLKQESLDQSNEVFKFQNWMGHIKIPVNPPEWVDLNYPKLLDPLHSNELALDLFRYSRGYTPPVEYTDDEWVSIICKPHFSYVPYAVNDGSTVMYKRAAFISDNGFIP